MSEQKSECELGSYGGAGIVSVSRIEEEENLTRLRLHDQHYEEQEDVL